MSSTIILLRGLEMEASAEDIRCFFKGIHIPEGGVFIVGGVLGEAFIAFNTEEDGMLAMQQSGRTIKNSKVDLCISSMLELEHKVDTFIMRKKSIKSLLKSKHFSNEEAVADKPVSSPPVSMQSDVQAVNMDTLDSKSILLGICNLLNQAKSSSFESTAYLPPSELCDAVNPGFIRLFGLPSTTTKHDICQIFQGLNVTEILVNVKLGGKHGCLVKFNSVQDAASAQGFNGNTWGSVCLEVRAATEKMWKTALQEDGYKDVVTMQAGLLNHTINNQKESDWHRNKRNSEPMQKTPKKFKNSPSTTDSAEYMVMVSNLPMSIVKTEIRELFGCPDIALSNVIDLLDSEGQKTGKVCLKFNKREDYDYAVNLSGCHVGSNAIEVSPITQEDMSKIMDAHRKHQSNQNKETNKLFHNGKIDDQDEQSHTDDPNARRCLYLRNMPADVNRSQIKGLFTENKLKEDDITLLYDNDGMCIGEAVVRFQSETNVALALMHHGRKFLGSKILLTPITERQMKNILFT